MRYTDSVVVTDDVTGSKRIVELGYVLPMYNIGEEVCYKYDGSEDEIVDVEIVGMDISVNFDKEKEQYITQTIYRLSDGALVEENEITSYNDSIGEDDDEG